MGVRERTVTAGVIAIAAWATTGVARADPPTPEQMAEQIRQLQAKVDRLEADRPAAGQTARPTSVPAATRPETPAAFPTFNPSLNPSLPPSNTTNNGVEPLGGADPINSNIKLPPIQTDRTDGIAPVLAGWNGTQFTIRSTDGNFNLHPGLVLDVRDLVSYRHDLPTGTGRAGEVIRTGDDTQNGVDLSRLRLIFDGTLFRQVSYFFQFSADQGQSLSLLDASVSYRFGDGPFTLKAGQFKDPVWHERNVAESNQRAVDRSLPEFFLGGGQGSRVQGGAITYDQDRFRGQVVAHDGYGSQNTKFFDAGGVPTGVGGAAGVNPTDYGFSGRAEYLALGTRTKTFNPFTEYDQFTSLGATQNILVLGGGLDYSQAESNDLILHTVDLQYNNVNGLSAFAGYYGSYRAIHTNQGVPPGFYYDPAFVAQVAWVFGSKFEPFARYDYTHLDPNSTRAVVGGLRSHLVQEVTVFGEIVVQGSARPLAGRADAVMLDSEGAIALVVDWKSDVAPEANSIRTHEGQLAFYLSATGAPRGALVYLTPGTVRWVERPDGAGTVSGGTQ